MNALQLLAAIPAIINAVKAAEEAIPTSGSGKAKADMVIQILQVIFEGLTEVVPLAQKIITIIVNTLNSTGVFKK